MNPKHHLIMKVIFLVGILVLLALIIPRDSPVEAQAEPRLSHSGCVYACLLDQYILTSKSNFYRWYGSAYTLAGCNNSTYQSFFENAVSALSVAFNAPGGVKMSCWDMLMGQTSVCASQCRATTPENRAYGPNLRVASISQAPGYLHAKITNTDHGYPPDLKVNAYSRKFYLVTTLKLNNGTPLVLDKSYMPYLSYPNWITWQNYNAYTECVNAFGSSDGRCKIISPLTVSDTVEWSVDFMDGVLYNLSGHISHQKGVSGSFENGFVILNSNNDSITIEQGPYSGFYWEKTHNRSKNTHTDKIVRWDANHGLVTITNKECWYCVGNRTDRDTYVFALRGPSNLRLPGTYQVEMVADVTHDKDFSNNRFSYTYTDREVGSEFDLDFESEIIEDDIEEEDISLDHLPVFQLPGPGVYSHELPGDGSGLMFRVDVPFGLYQASIRLRNQASGWPPISFYVNEGSIAQPFMSPYDQYACHHSVRSNLFGTCYLYHPDPGPVYIYVTRGPAGATFQLEVNWVTQAEFAVTESWQATQEAQYAQTQQALIRTFTEVEPNDTRETANTWDMVEPFTGELTHGDKDYVSVTFQISGIYTFGITEISPQLEVNLWLVKGPGSTIGRVSSADKGEGVSLTFDASVGETFYLRIDAFRYDPDGSFYQLELLDMIPDPYEPNDQISEATYWDIIQGPIEGYFWEVAHISRDRADYYRFTAPMTADGSAITLTVSNPSNDLSICMRLIDQTPYTIHTPPCFETGQDAFLTYTMVPGQDYYVKLSTMNNKTSLEPYQLNALYVGDDNGTGLTEVEPNDTRQTANFWDMEQPFRGVLSTRGDRDYILIEIPISGIYTFSITEVSPNLKVGMNLLRAPGGGFINRVNALARGESVHLTMDGSAGEQYYLVVFADQWGMDGSLYQVSLTGFIHDPHEPNDQRSEAAYWDIDEGPIQGYFWELTHVSKYRADYFRFTAPIVDDGSPTSFLVSNPAADIRICLSLLNHTGSTLLSSVCFPMGENASLEYFLAAGMDYYIKLSTVNNKTSLQPYTLSMDFLPGSADEPIDDGRQVRLHGFVYRQWGLLPLPIANVDIYVHIPGQPAFMLGRTNIFGTYSARVNIADDQQVIIWPELDEASFSPEMDTFYVINSLRQHRSVFLLEEEQHVQQTPTPTPQITDTPSPPLIQTELAATATPPLDSFIQTATPQPEQRRDTITPTATATNPLEDADDLGESTLIIGTVWRLFNTGPAGVGTAEVILSINGIDQPAVKSMIDGLYRIEIDGLQPGDALRLRAQAPQDEFEPLYYEWQAEKGVNRWEYDFYSYWDEITPPTSQDQNRIWGTVWDQFGADVSGLYLNVQMGTSDAIQRIGPTDADGYFEGMITLPDRIMVTVWVDAEGYLPSKIIFFHAYEPEDRELVFVNYYGEDLQ